MKISNFINKLISTEKSVRLGNDNRYVLEVSLDATKGIVADEIKRIWGVDAVEIQTIIMPGKKKRIPKTSRFTKTAKKKKAIVKLKAGQKIDMAEAKK